MIDADRDYTPDDVLTCDDALSLAVLGYKVRAVDMQDGCYVDYNFNGWRINFEGGSSSGWSARKHDYAADWHVVADEPKPKMTFEEKVEANSKWGRATVAPDIQKLGRALRPVPTFEVPVGAVVRDWGLKPAKVVASPPAPNVGKWGKPTPVEPKRDAWGRKKD